MEKGPTKERYYHQEREPYWQAFWDSEKINKFDPNSSDTLFTIDTPPPTISGALHLGHVYSYSQAEVVARYRRMIGNNVRYPMGFDDNGLPTERLVEKEKKIKAQQMSPDDFIEVCLDVTKSYTEKYTNLWKSLGLSVDWGLEYSSISPEAQKLAQTAFKELYDCGVIYQKEAVSLYCHTCLTSVAQAEVDDKEEPSLFYDLLFKEEGGKDIVVSTTRPELLPSCVAVFIHPEDKRYSRLKETSIKTPFGKTVPVLTDKKVSMEKGTGVVMCCTYGDETDLYWVRKHNLPEKIIINKYGKFVALEDFPELSGKSIVNARKAIVDRLRKKGLIKNEQEIIHTVKVHERCDTPIELLLTKQWFVKMLDKKENLLKAADKIKWYPSYMKKRYVDWVNGLKWDWCISRGRFFGIPIPAYTCNSCSYISVPDEKEFPVDPRHNKELSTCPDCKHGRLIPEKDVLDTWFTSSLTPDLNNNHLANGQLKGKLYPMSMRPQGHDIIRTWVVYSVLMGLYRHKEIPWHELMISGHVLLRRGEKISKRTGGGKLRPEEVIQTDSADAVRYAMFGAVLGKDSYFDEKEVEKGKKLVNKIYNAGKLVLTNLQDYPPVGWSSTDEVRLEPIDKWIINRSLTTAKEMSKELEKYEYSKARQLFEDFFWKEFCDNYLEIVKGRLKATEGSVSTERISAQYALYNAYLNSLKMISPFMPHITEEMFHADVSMNGNLTSKSGSGFFASREAQKSIHLTHWPSGDRLPLTADEEKGVELMLDLIAKARKYKSEQYLIKESLLERLVVRGTAEQRRLLDPFWNDLLFVVRIPEVSFQEKGVSSTKTDQGFVDI